MTEEEKRERKRQQSIARNRRYRLEHREKCAAYAKAYQAARRKPLAPLPLSKVCKHCRIEKPREAFFKVGRVKFIRSTRGALGVDAVCKACRSHLRDPSLKSRREKQADLATSGLKQCGACQAAKPIADFYVRRASKDGLSYTCRTCTDERSEAWRKQHPTAHADWYLQNKNEKRRYFEQWRLKHADRLRATYRQWAKENPDKINALIAKRHAAKLKATPKWVNHAKIQTIYREATRLTRQTGIRHEVDHIVPLRSSVVCGLHVESNLQILTSEQNKKKSNRLDYVATVVEAIA